MLINVWNIGAFIFSGLLIVSGIFCAVQVYRIDKQTGEGKGGGENG